MTHGKHLFKTRIDTSIATMCEHPSKMYMLPHWKCMLYCCLQCPRIDLPSSESNQ